MSAAAILAVGGGCWDERYCGCRDFVLNKLQRDWRAEEGDIELATSED